MSRYLKKTSFPITLVVLIIAAIFIFRGEAQQPKNSKTSSNPNGVVDPISGTAVAFAESDAVRDLPDATAEEIISFGQAREINEDNVIPYKTLNPAANSPKWPAVDAALSGRPQNIPSQNLPGTPLVSFDGMADALVTRPETGR